MIVLPMQLGGKNLQPGSEFLQLGRNPVASIQK
jgi:hypothetical protein